ncbi:zinc finger protein [Macleaya cordata]|uniref:Zinc finger protein n=1 Tax=Macleaya cordata TaxID=56857 RepID=A0A200QPM2_MACCD|nr:zinc finger protein [Macleaya cordata]
MSNSNNNRFNSRNWSLGSTSRGHVANNSRPFQAPRPSPYRPAIPIGTSFPRRIIVLPGEMAHAVNPRIRQFIQEFPPMITTDQWPMQLPPPQEDESILTQEEQHKSLMKLKKIVYNPPPKRKTRKWCLYYRDNATDVFNSKEEENDEDSKACVICLDDFVPNHEVLVTPCNHMFHEDCIVPWTKSQGRCPICRAALGEPRRENNLSTNNNNNNANTNINVMENDIITDDLISLLRAMEFERITFPHY